MPLVQVGDFYINQTSIIEDHCINKDLPELNCNGHCYLKDQLTTDLNITNSEQEALTASGFFMPYAFSNIKVIEVLSFDLNNTKFYSKDIFDKTSSFCPQIFVPPQFA